LLNKAKNADTRTGGEYFQRSGARKLAVINT